MDDLFTKKVGPLSIGAWALLVGGGAVVAFTLSNRSKDETTTRTVVDQVAVPVGAVAAYDGAPSVTSPVIRINTEGIDALTKALTGNTGATKSLTSATKSAANVTSKNTSAVSGNTSALKKNTSAVSGNTAATKAQTSATKSLTSATKAAASKPKTVTKTSSASKPKTSSTRYYTVKPGDSLSKIASRYTGNGNRWPELYNLNKSAIDASAKRRGKRAPYYNHIISGQRFKIPTGW